MSSNSNDIRDHNPTVQQLLELHDAALAISGELDLSRLLQRIVDVARQLTHSRYAALGIVGGDGLIEQFLTSGLSATEREALGELPRGHGLLGLLIKEGRPLRIVSIGDDPQSVGFPPNHPIMVMLLGMPIIYRGQIVGDLYLTDKENGEMWSDSDEWLTSLLASHAAIAIGNAHLYQVLEQARYQADAERQRLKVLLENLPEGVVVCDATGVVTLLNPIARQLFGWELGHHVTARLARIQHPDGSDYTREDLPLVRTLMEDVRVRGQHLVVSYPDPAQPRDIFAGTMPLHDGEGRLIGAVGVYQDITALKEVERLKDDFFSMATHELRTPLTSITMSSGLLAELLAPQGGRVGVLARLVAENAQRMRTLVDDLLDLSRLEHGRLVLHRRAFDLGVLVRHVVDQMEPLAERKAQHLTVHLLPTDTLVQADSSRIEQVLLNLLGNAIKYTPAAGAVGVTLSTGKGEVLVQVQDSGPGVPPGEHAQIFERFYRTQLHEVDRSSGTGLGLPIARMLVQLHGGRLWYEDAPGGGSTFCFTVPTD